MPQTRTGEGYRDFSEPRFYEAAALSDITKINRPPDKAHALLATNDSGALEAFKFQSDSTDTADNYDVITPLNPAFSARGRWHRVGSVYDAGALGGVGDALTDNTSLFQGIADRIASRGGGLFRLPAGTFMIRNKLAFHGHNVSIMGEGRNSIFKQFGNAKDGIGTDSSGNYSNWTLANFAVEDNIAATAGGSGIDLYGVSYSNVYNVFVEGAYAFRYALRLYSGTYNTIFNRFYGLQLRASATASTNAALYCEGIGGGLEFFGGKFGCNGSTRVAHINGTGQVNLDKVHFDGEYLNGIRNECAGLDSNSIFQGCRFESNTPSGSAIYTRGMGVVVLNNSYASGFNPNVDFLLTDEFCTIEDPDVGVTSTRGSRVYGGAPTITMHKHFDNPSAPAADYGIHYYRAQGSKLALVACFPSGEVQPIATESGGPVRAGQVRITGASSPYSVATNDYLIECDTTSGSITVNLPDVTENIGRILAIKKIIAANTMTLDGSGAQTIDGAATVAATTQWACFHIQAGTNGWFVI